MARGREVPQGGGAGGESRGGPRDERLRVLGESVEE